MFTYLIDIFLLNSSNAGIKFEMFTCREQIIESIKLWTISHALPGGKNIINNAVLVNISITICNTNISGQHLECRSFARPIDTK